MHADARETWIEAGLAELAEGGAERLRVEVLARRLGVTKGGFYWHFKDRRALLDAILENWRRGRIEAIEQQTALAEKTPAERLAALIRLYSERVNARAMAIELAVRQWARLDRAAAAAAARVDAARLENVARLYRAQGLAPADAKARAYLFYAFVFGQSLLFLERSPRARRELIAACANALAGSELRT
jgi:AcrR family transcriptional regulator